jgi:hypothetical protein
MPDRLTSGMPTSGSMDDDEDNDDLYVYTDGDAPSMDKPKRKLRSRKDTLGRPTPVRKSDAFISDKAAGSLSTKTFRCMVPVTEPYGKGPRKCYVMPGMCTFLHT